MALWKSFHPSVNIAVDQMTLGGGLISSSCVTINEKTLFIYVLTQNIPLKAPYKKSIVYNNLNVRIHFLFRALLSYWSIYSLNKKGNVLSRNNEARSCNRCCSGRAISITYSEWVFVALVCSKNSACVVWHCHLRPVWLYDIFPHIILKGTTFEKSSYCKRKACFDSFYNFCLKHFLFWEEFSEIVL